MSPASATFRKQTSTCSHFVDDSASFDGDGSEAQPWDKEYRERALVPPSPEDYEKIIGERGNMPMDQWLQHLEQVMFRQSELGEIDWESDFDLDVILKIAGGSLAVGVIDRVMRVKELIDCIIHDAEQMLRQKGNLGKLMV